MQERIPTIVQRPYMWRASIMKKKTLEKNQVNFSEKKSGMVKPVVTDGMIN